MKRSRILLLITCIQGTRLHRLDRLDIPVMEPYASLIPRQILPDGGLISEQGQYGYQSLSQVKDSEYMPDYFKRLEETNQSNPQLVTPLEGSIFEQPLGNLREYRRDERIMRPEEPMRILQEYGTPQVPAAQLAGSIFDQPLSNLREVVQLQQPARLQENVESRQDLYQAIPQFQENRFQAVPQFQAMPQIQENMVQPMPQIQERPMPMVGGIFEYPLDSSREFQVFDSSKPDLKPTFGSDNLMGKDNEIKSGELIKSDSAMDKVDANKESNSKKVIFGTGKKASKNDAFDFLDIRAILLSLVLITIL